jgi:hypothetical protein
VPAPCIRAGFLQSNYAALDGLGQGTVESVRDRLGIARVHAITDASRIAWLPVELDVALAEAVEAERGLAGLRWWLREGVERSENLPLLAPFLSGARAILGLGTAHGVLRRTPQMWSVMYRDCGIASYERASDHEARVSLRELPAAVVSSAAWREQVGGGLEVAVSRMSGVRATVAAELDGRAGRATFHCRF